MNLGKWNEVKIKEAYDNDQVGEYDFEFTATDSYTKLSATTTFKVKVECVPTAILNGSNLL